MEKLTDKDIDEIIGTYPNLIKIAPRESFEDQLRNHLKNWSKKKGGKGT